MLLRYRRLLMSILVGCGCAVSGCSQFGLGSVDLSGPDEATAAVPASGLRRLSAVEYDNTVYDLLTDNTRPGALGLPEDSRDPFDNYYQLQTPSAVLISSVETLAGEIANRAVGNATLLAQILPCTPTSNVDATCFRSFVSSFGAKALRRPLTAAEVDAYLPLLDFAGENNPAVNPTFNTAIELAISAFLQDPEFLYRIEIGTPSVDDPNLIALSDYEIASRMSYFLWGTMPDDALFADAAAGLLKNSESRRLTMERMLTDSKARTQVDRFHSLWLGYSKMSSPADLVSAMRAESKALVERYIFDEPNSSYWNIFRASSTFVDQTLATHYGLTDAGAVTPSWVSYDGTARRGLLSQATVLSGFSKFGDTSPTQRGIFILSRLLCQTIGKPPPNVNADQPPVDANDPNACKYDRYSMHRTSSSCAACHAQLDPVGFGLENYDKEGRYRAHDDSRPECVIAGEGKLRGTIFSGPAELGEQIIATGDFEACIARQTFRFANGRKETSEDFPGIEELANQFSQNNQDFLLTWKEIVAHEFFGYKRLEDN